MKEMIGYCGYNCHLCAARSNDPVLRQKMVDGWKRILGHQNYTAENVSVMDVRVMVELQIKNVRQDPVQKKKE